MHQVTMQAIALQNTRQHEAQAAAERARLLNSHSHPRPRRSLRGLLPPVTRRPIAGRPARWAQARRSSAAAAKI
jgi:hypothetical protein